MELLVFVGALAALGLLAARFGHDSRDFARGGAWHTWQRSRAAEGSELWGCVDVSGVGLEAGYRIGELRAAAAQAQRLRPGTAVAPSGAVVGGGSAARRPLRPVAAMAGAVLVRVGQRLQAYGRAPAGAAVAR